MALTEPEARVLGTLANPDIARTLTVHQLAEATDLSEQCIRRALRRLSRSGLASGTKQSPSRWRRTDRGRLALIRPGYSDYITRAAG